MEAAGERIPGSNLYRAFCATCGEPMRVGRNSLNAECLECQNPGRPQFGGSHGWREEPSGSWANIVRQYEDG